MAKRKPSGYQQRYRHMRRLGYDPERARRAAKSGCYIATSVYGSYDCPQVWVLRRYRDGVLSQTWYGRTFIKVYYALSPQIVKWWGSNKWFKKLWKTKLDKIVDNLQERGIENTPYNDRNW